MYKRLLATAKDWANYQGWIATQAGGNVGEVLTPPVLPCLVVTHVEYLGSVTASSRDYQVTHLFVTPDDARDICTAEGSGDPCQRVFLWCPCPECVVYRENRL